MTSMGYRDDHDAAIARIEALERDNARLEADNARLQKENAELARTLAAPKSEPRMRRPRVGGTYVVVVAALLGGFAVIHALRSCDPSTASFEEITRSAGSGTLVSTGPTFGGPWTFELARCASGQHTQFFGVDLVAKHDKNLVMRIVEDPIRGTIVKLNVVGKGAARFIERAECTTWDIAIKPTHTTVNGIRLVDGHVELACTFPGDQPGTLAGRIEFRRCN
jgi:hypothetical protein